MVQDWAPYSSWRCRPVHEGWYLLTCLQIRYCLLNEPRQGWCRSESNGSVSKCNGEGGSYNGTCCSVTGRHPQSRRNQHHAGSLRHGAEGDALRWRILTTFVICSHRRGNVTLSRKLSTNNAVVINNTLNHVTLLPKRRLPAILVEFRKVQFLSECQNLRHAN